MEKNEKRNIVEMICRILSIVMLFLFVHVYLCIVLFGNRMNYNEGLKLATFPDNRILFFLNEVIAKEIAFYLPWDIGVVRSIAGSLAEGQATGYNSYLSMYSNNLPIVYILSKLHEWVMEQTSYPYPVDFIGVQVNCACISIGGFFGCLTVKKKITKNVLPD